MPQADRHRERIVPIEFDTGSDLSVVIRNERLVLVLVSSGKAELEINGIAVSVEAPSVLMLSAKDSIVVKLTSRIMFDAFSFHPRFVNSALTFERLEANDFSETEDEHDRNMMNMFLHRSDGYNGYIPLPANMYFRISEWMDVIGKETFAQSDVYWTCRIRRHLLQALYLIDDIHMTMISGEKSRSMVDTALEYIHVNYTKDISLSELCTVAGTNPTTLNKKFKEALGQTAISYLVSYRVKIACKALSHTNLTLAEIAEAIGFSYDTYFIKQFTLKMGETPTEYRSRTQIKGKQNVTN